MPFRVEVSPDSHWPSFKELDPVMDLLDDPVDLSWTGTRDDQQLWEKWRGRSLVLHVADQEQAERALWLLGGPLVLTPEDLTAAKKALTVKTDPSWRPRVEAVGHSRAVLLLTSVVGSSIRSGKAPAAASSVVGDCLFRRISPADADVLMRLRTRS